MYKYSCWTIFNLQLQWLFTLAISDTDTSLQYNWHPAITQSPNFLPKVTEVLIQKQTLATVDSYHKWHQIILPEGAHHYWEKTCEKACESYAFHRYFLRFSPVVHNSQICSFLPVDYYYFYLSVGTPEQNCFQLYFRGCGWKSKSIVWNNEEQLWINVMDNLMTMFGGDFMSTSTTRRCV